MQIKYILNFWRKFMIGVIFYGRKVLWCILQLLFAQFEVTGDKNTRK